MPEPEDPVKTPWELLKRKQAEKLTDHSYQVSEAEWDLIRQTYESAPGYRALNTIVGDTLLGADPVQPTPTVKSKNRSAPMTLKAYNALSPAQRAAVDFNTLLVGAREKDLNTSYAPTQGETKKYDRTVEKMFGEEGGSETYAPETVGLLKSIDFKGVGQDLDEYLSLERAVSAKELGDFKFTQDTPVRLPAAAAPTPQQYTEARRPENLATLDSTIIEAAADQIAEAMTSADTVMRDFTDAMLVQRYTDVQALGGAGGGLAEPEWGYGQPGAFTSENDALGDEFFKFVYDFTTDTKNTSMEPIWGYLDQYQFTPAETQQLFTYISDRAKNDKRYGDSEGSGNRRSPQQILQFAGIGG